MIQPVLFKSAIYWLCVLIVRLAAAGGAIADFPAYLVEHFSWSPFLSIQLWLMVLFLVYVAIHELNMLFGHGELYRLFFHWRSSEAKLARRRRGSFRCPYASLGHMARAPAGAGARPRAALLRLRSD
jgi:hypothetical protein